MTNKSGPGKRNTRKTKRDDAVPAIAFDRRLMEKEMAAVTRQLEEHDFASAEEANAFLQTLYANGPLQPPEPETPLEKAQEVVYQALTANGARRVALARKALTISPDCADAYVLLAEATPNVADAQQFYQQGVEAGARALGEQYFAEAVGDFWGLIETRPYMRARLGLAMTLWRMGSRKEAISHASEMLRLNPGDNQGIRYLLAFWLLETGDLAGLSALLAQYPDEVSANWAYTRCLLAYRQTGASRKAEQALKQALDANPHVPLYLLGVSPPPKRMPEYYGMGDENEAIFYVAEAAKTWIESPDALDWFARTTLKVVLTERVKQEKQRALNLARLRKPPKS